MLVREKGEEHDFLPVQPVQTDAGIRLDVLPAPYDPRFQMRWTHPNPLLSCSEASRLRKMLFEWLETQKA